MKSVVRERRKLRKMAKLAVAGRIPVAAITESFITWKAHAQRGNCRKIVADMQKLYDKLLSEVKKNESQE